MENSCQLLVQLGLQCGCAHHPPLTEPMKVVVEGDGCPEVGIYESNNHLPDKVHQTNATVSPPLIQKEDHDGPGHIHG